MLAETARRPSGVIATDRTQSVCPWRVFFSAPLARSHTLSVMSQLAETARRPSGVIATEVTERVCPWRVCSSAPLSRSHTLSVLSLLPDTARRPSGVIATDCTKSVCPPRVFSSAPLARSHTRSVLSLLAETARRPSGVIATHFTELVCPWRVCWHGGLAAGMGGRGSRASQGRGKVRASSSARSATIPSQAELRAMAKVSVGNALSQWLCVETKFANACIRPACVRGWHTSASSCA